MRTAGGARLDGGRVLLLALLLALGWWFWESPALWPLKLLVVMMHESGHAVATWAVGGSVERIVLRHDESGACLSRVPEGVLRQVAVYSAGYVGSALVGAVLLLGTLRWRLGRWVLALTSTWLLVMGVLYAGDPFTLLFCVGTALLFGALARLLPAGAVDVLDLGLAGFTALYVLFDLRDDLWGAGGVSDAELLARATWVPAAVWAVLWTAVSVGLLALFVWLALSRPPAPTARR